MGGPGPSESPALGRGRTFARTHPSVDAENAELGCGGKLAGAARRGGPQCSRSERSRGEGLLQPAPKEGHVEDAYGPCAEVDELRDAPALEGRWRQRRERVGEQGQLEHTERERDGVLRPRVSAAASPDDGAGDHRARVREGRGVGEAESRPARGLREDQRGHRRDVDDGDPPEGAAPVVRQEDERGELLPDTWAKTPHGEPVARLLPHRSQSRTEHGHAPGA